MSLLQNDFELRRDKIILNTSSKAENVFLYIYEVNLKRN